MDPWMPTIVFAVLLGVFIRELWRRTVVRKAMSLSDEMVRLLTAREVSWLRNGLLQYLATAEGTTLAGDPRIIRRLELFQSIQQERSDKLTGLQHARALRAVGLTAGAEQQ